MGKQIWIVENRENVEGITISYIDYVATSVEDAVQWINENKDGQSNNFWWAVQYNEVGIDISEQDIPEANLYLFNNLGEELYWQPVSDEPVMHYGDKVRFTLNYVPDSSYNDVEFEGTFVKASFGDAHFKDVFIISRGAKPVNEKFRVSFFSKVENIHSIRTILTNDKKTIKL